MKIIEEQLRLTGNLIERKSLDAQTGLLRRTVTVSFSSAQNGMLLGRAFYAVKVRTANVSEPDRKVGQLWLKTPATQLALAYARASDTEVPSRSRVSIS